MTPSTVSVVVPVRDGGAPFALCLDGIASSDYELQEVIVVDDGSADGSGELARQRGFAVHTHAKSLGPAAARNAGVAAASGDLVVLVDADVVVRPETIGQLVAFLEEERSRGSAVVAASASYCADSRVTGFGSRYLNLKQRAFQQHLPPVANTAWTAAFGIWRDAFVASGGFDDAQRHAAADDLVLGCRVRATGAELAFLHRTEVEHLKELSVWGVLTFHHVHAREWTRAAPRYRALLPAKTRNSRRAVGNTLLAVSLVPQLACAVLGPPGLRTAAAASSVGTLGVAALWNAAFLRDVARLQGTVFSAMCLPLVLAEGVANATGVAAGLVANALSAPPAPSAVPPEPA